MYELIRANKIKSVILVVLIGSLLLLLGFTLGEYFFPGGGIFGLGAATILWATMSSVTYFSGDRVLLAASRAKPLQKHQNPRLFNVVEEMSIAAGLPMPKIYVIHDSAPNAFAAGRSPEKATIAVTTGLLEKLNRDELQGVIAHEMSHIKNRDVLFMTMIGVMVGVIVLMCDAYFRHLFIFGSRSRRDREEREGQPLIALLALVLAILAPIIARLMYLAISRRREYLADACAVELTRYPEGLASALEKIANDKEVLEVANRATAPMYIVNPIKSWEARARRFTSTHPPIEERIRILRTMVFGFTLDDYNRAYRQISGKNLLKK